MSQTEHQPCAAAAEPWPGSFEEFLRRPYFAGLDGLRALAILMVFFYHSPRWPANPLSTFQNNGRYGVSVFFVISGFLICTLLLRERQNFGRVNLAQFYSRRALRLLPLYYTLLAVHVVLVFGLHVYSPENRQIFLDKLPSYLLYFSNWLPTATQGPFFCAWSLAVEEQFYLIFSLLLVVLPPRALVITLLSLTSLTKCLGPSTPYPLPQGLLSATRSRFSWECCWRSC